jgi:uncharacterized membrane protein
MTPATPNPPAAKAAALPLVALILGVIGFCVPPLFLVAIVLAIISLVRGAEPAYAARKALAIITLALGVVYVPVVGILAAIAIPNFIKFQARSKQADCKTNLKLAWTLEASNFAEEDKYLDSPTALHFEPMGSRYLYVFGPGRQVEPSLVTTPVDTLLAGIPAAIRQDLGVTGDCPDCSVTIACAGNIDNDATIDVWTVSSQPRIVNGEQVPAGMPFNEVNDVAD